MQSRCGGIVILFLGMDSVRRARHNMVGNHTYNSVIYFELVWRSNSGPRHQTDARIAHTVITPVQNLRGFGNQSSTENSANHT